MMAFKGYVTILIWIELWPPLYAVLNYMASIYTAYDLAAAADLGTGTKALSLQTASTIYSGAISGEAIVGYLAISIPFIAWAALKRMENFGTAQLAPNRTSAFMGSMQNDLSGNTFSSNALTGHTAVSLLRNQGFASRVVSMRVTEQDVTEASRQADSARSEAVSAGQPRSAVLTEAFTRGLAKMRPARSSSGSTSPRIRTTLRCSCATLNSTGETVRRPPPCSMRKSLDRDCGPPAPSRLRSRSFAVVP